MKTIKNTLIILSIVSISFMACTDNDDNEKPVVTNLEIGENDTIYAGDGVHMDFSVSDNDMLDYYTVEIHQEEDHEKSSLETTWEFDSTFTEIHGLKNYTVHHHAIKVPEEAREGEYHCHINVADISGNTTSVETEVVLSHDEHEENHH